MIAPLSLQQIIASGADEILFHPQMGTVPHEIIMETIAKKQGINLIGVDIGGATTDVFSVFHGIFNRTVSANLGMSYSISNVLAEATLSFVGLGFPDSVPSWGTMLIEAANVGSLARFPWTLAPAVAIFLIALSANSLTSRRNLQQ